MRIATGIVTISDRAAQGLYPDLSGPALQNAVVHYGWELVTTTVIPDDLLEIQRALRAQISARCHLILTTGGTGIGPRDITPEAVRSMDCRELPGFGETMRRESLSLTRNAILSRSLAAVVDNTLIICLPGKPSAAVECLGVVADTVPHCLELLSGSTHPMDSVSPG